MRLPPNVKAESFSEALKQFEQAVGKEWVFSSEEDIDLYRDSYTPFWHEEEEPIPSAAVAPSSTEEVQKVVRIANSHKIPLWIISTGKNLGYGGPAPLLGGSIVLDLKRMNRVLEVDERNHCALVEPGVSYFDLYRYIQERGLKVMVDVPDPGWGSVMGNALDRGVGYGPFRDHFDSHCGLEVVLPNGELLRTGMGALPGAKTWQQYKYGYGPSIDGLFCQSSLGVVTKMGFYLYPQPEAFRAGSVTVPKRQDIVPLVDTVNYLVNSGIAQGQFQISNALASPFGPPDLELANLLAKPGGPSTEELERYGAEKNLGYWSTMLKFYGPQDVIDAQWNYAKKKFSSIPGVRFKEEAKYTFPIDPKMVEQIPHLADLGIPNLSIFGIGVRPQRPMSYGHLWFSPIIPATGEAILEVTDVLTKAFRELGVPMPLGSIFPISFFPRTFVLIFGMEVEHNVAKNREMRDKFRKMVKIASEHGWGEYRTPTAFMSDVMDVYSFNNHALRRFHETIKDAVDPNGILAPGKAGIWPKSMRKERA